ncbi:hypothetical protein C2U63_27195, partial [Burkholderia pseudomallei]
MAHRSLIDWLIDVLIDSPARSNARANRPDALRDPPRQAVKRPDGHPCPRSHRHPMPVARALRRIHADLSGELDVETLASEA